MLGFDAASPSMVCIRMERREGNKGKERFTVLVIS